GLARNVLSATGIGRDRGPRSNVNTPARALCQHEPRSLLRAKERTLQINSEDRVPGLLVELQHSSTWVDAGVVDENVQAAELCPKHSEQRLDLAQVARRPPGSR